MMGRRTFGAIVMGGVTALLSGCSALFGEDTLRHKITVEVDTPAGLRTGVSVIETTATEGSTWGGNGPGIHFGLKGEAVAVDLPALKGLGSQTLFALLRGADGSQGDSAGFQARLISDALRDGAQAKPPLDIAAMDLMQARAAIKDADAALELPQKLYPMLVTFRDITDPKSVTQVDPTDLAAAFGPGVKLRRITVAVTDEAVTSGIGERLGWLGNYYGKLFNGERYEKITPDLSGHLGAGDFSTELSK